MVDFKMSDVEFHILSMHLQNLMRSPYIQILFWLICFDIVSGYIKAFKLKRFDSKTSTNGLLRHALVCAVVIVTAVYARALGHQEIGITTCLFFIFSYAVSLAENWEALGLPFPEAIKPFLKTMQKQQENKFKKITNKEEVE
jgi:toxin secretion/phage lysis holin|nr:MAG TPA: holin [Caudoviricetes sp.]